MTKHTLAIVSLALFGCGQPASVATTSAAPAAAIPAGDWPTFNRTLAGDRFSPLAEIDRSNVASARRRVSVRAAGSHGAPDWPDCRWRRDVLHDRHDLLRDRRRDMRRAMEGGAT